MKNTPHKAAIATWTMTEALDYVVAIYFQQVTLNPSLSDLDVKFVLKHTAEIKTKQELEPLFQERVQDALGKRRAYLKDIAIHRWIDSKI